MVARAARQPRASSGRGIEVGAISNFSGGANLRDTADELALNEAYGSYNCTFDERGGVASRLGYTKRNVALLGGPSYSESVLAYHPDLYWRFAEGAGTAIVDSSGNSHGGAYGTGVTLGQASLLSGDPSNKAAAFDNTTNAVAVASPYNPYTPGSRRTFMGLANRTATTDIDPLFGSIVAHGFGPTVLYISAGGEDVVFDTDSSVTWAAAWPGVGVVVHWALTYNDATKTAELFINGVSKGTRVLASGFPSQSNPFWAGAYQGVAPGSATSFNGKLDEIAVFPDVLSVGAIQAIFNSIAVAPGGIQSVVNDFYSSLLNLQITQVGASLYRADNTSAVKTFSTTACVTFVEFNNLVVAVHPVDGIYTSPDGTTWTKVVAANAPTTGTNCVAAWMGRLFVGLSDGSVHWSDPGTVATWTATNFNEIWTKDQQPIIALHVGSGQDIQGRAGLLVFKQDSVYRINDPVTGAYTVLSTTVGCGGPKAVVGVGARVCWVGKRGVYWWMENQAEPFNASDLLRPLWRPDQLSFANQAGWAAGRRGNRALFSVSTINSGVNDLALELHPDEGWIAPRSDAMACYSASAGTNEQTYGGSPTVKGQLYQLDTGGTDDGASITGWLQTRWVVLNGGMESSLWQVRVHGRGSGTMTALADYADTLGNQYPFAMESTGVFYDNGVLYDDGVTTYATIELQSTEAVYNVATCRAFSLRFDFTVNSTVFGRTLVGNMPQPVLGAFCLYRAEYLFVPLGAT